MSITWEEPPAALSGNGKSEATIAIANELRANPGKWALIKTDCSASTAAGYRRGKVVAFRPVGDWEFATREVAGPRAGKVYGRYIGN